MPVTKILNQVLQNFSVILKEQHYSKGYQLHREQTICQRLYLVKSGIIRAYYHKDGKGITAYIAVDHGMVTAVDSFIQKKPSRFNIETLEKTTVLTTSRSDLRNFLNQHPQFEPTARLFLEELYMELADRMESMMFHNAQERYDALVRQNPYII
jgi:CRP-like cAMP-binding protein